MSVMRSLMAFFIFSNILTYSFSVQASPGYTTYQAKIIKPDGYPLEATSVNFRFTVMDPTASCILYTETYSAVNMQGSGGLISFSLGSGVKQYPVSTTTFAEIFDNSQPGLSCDDGDPGVVDPVYVPQPSHTRKIVMQFQDANGWQTLPAMSVNAVPYAMYATEAQKLGGVSAGAYVKYSTIPTCGASEALRYNGATFSCIAGGSLSSVSSGDITTALGYTPANQASVGASFTIATSYYNSLEASHTSLSNSVGVSFALATGYYNALATSHTLLASQVNGLGSSYTALSSDLINLRLSVSGTQSDITGLQSSVGSLTASMSVLTPSQWSTSGTTINYMNGNVGIGTSNPSAKLEVSGAIKIVDGTQGLGRVLTSDASGLASWQVLPSGASGTVTNVSSTNNYITIANPTTIPSLTLNVGTASNTVAAGNDSRIVGALQSSNNLSDLVSATQARSNLGLGSVAVYNVGIGANNIVQLNGSSQLPALNAGLLTNINADNISSGSLSPLRLPAFTGDVSSTAGTNSLILTNTGVSAGTYNQVTVDAKGRVTSASNTTLTSGEVTTALGYTPAASGVVSSQWTTSGTTINYLTGNVGIGTTSPSVALEVSGGVKLRGPAAILDIPVTSGATGYVTMAGELLLHAYGDYNTYFGKSAGNLITNGTQNTGIGYHALKDVTDGYENVALGDFAMAKITTGGENTALGSEAMSFSVSGSGNVAVGIQALMRNTNDYNTVVGAYALNRNGNGANNTGMGYAVMNKLTSGSNNVSVGWMSLSNVTTGNSNIAIGYNSGLDITTGSGNVIIGGNRGASFATDSNNISINDGIGNERIRVVSSGNVGIGTTNPSARLDVSGTAAMNSSIEGVSTYVDTGTSYTIADSSLNIRRLTLTGDATVRLPQFTSVTPKVFTLTVFFKQDGTGSHTLSILGNGATSDTIKWDGGSAPSISTSAGKITIIQFTKPSDETVWYASKVWQED